jgi:hypothetical protein
MRTRLGPGPASIEGLRWLCRVGPAPIDAWACAMGWAPGNARSHAARLTRERSLARVARPPGEGSLFFATRQGTRVAGVDLSPAPAPAPIWWDHLSACAWVAAWLTIREREMRGPRELMADQLSQGEVKGVAGSRRLVHTTDLVGILPGRRPAVIEVELAHKSKARLRAILGLYCRWIANGKVGACLYVCGNGEVRKLVVAQAEEVGLRETDGSLRVEMLDAIKELVRNEARDVPGLLPSLTDNFSGVVAHRQTAPESRDWLAKLIGTRALWQSTNQTTGHGSNHDHLRTPGPGPPPGDDLSCPIRRPLAGAHRNRRASPLRAECPPRGAPARGRRLGTRGGGTNRARPPQRTILT